MSSGMITTKDGTRIFYKDWGSRAKAGHTLVFHHGWPLSSDDWDAQLMFFLKEGFRVVAHDRRGHGRSSQVAAGPFYGFNRPSAQVSEGVIRNWWRQGMMGGIKAQYDCIKAFSETDFTDDVRAIEVPVLVMHGEDDQVVPIADSALLAIKLLKNGTLKTYPGYSHGMATTHAEVINRDILAFIKNGIRHG
jgi:non-heme chloroperoxidase